MVQKPLDVNGSLRQRKTHWATKARLVAKGFT